MQFLSLIRIFARIISMNSARMERFEEWLHKDVHEYLTRRGAVDERLPECPDVEERWEAIAKAYLPDGVREFNQYPTASLGWMMYIGMALARMWDRDWLHYAQMEDLYVYLRDKRGYDEMDEYIREEILELKDDESSELDKLTSDTAAHVLSFLRHQPIEPGTPEAFRAYVACLHQLYLMGMATWLRRMGYHMTKV